MITKLNKKAQFESMLYVIVSIFIVAIVIFFLSHTALELYDKFDEVLGDMPDYNESEARDAIQTIKGVEETNIWDYAFLAIFIGLIIQMLLFSFATRINIAFYWIFGLLSIIILIVGVILSNIWQEVATQAEFATTILRFPITNMLLGTYYPTAIVAVLLLGMIILFGKPPREEA